MITRGYKTELKLNNEQRSSCIKAAGVSRFTYNWGLQQKKEGFKTTGKTPNFIELNRRLNALKITDFPWLYEVSSYITTQALRNLDRAYQNFFKKIAKFPKFKSKKNSKNKFKLAGDIKVTEKTIQLPRLGKLRLKERGYLPTNAKILSATVSEHAGRWFVSINVEEEKVEYTGGKDSHDVVGVDLGVKTLATVSDGTRHENPNALKKNLKKLKRLQQSLARKKIGSNNRKKAVSKVAKLHFRISNIRKDALHKITTTLAKTKRVVGIEDLSVSRMLKNKYLARSISDVGMFEFRRQLCYKREWYNCKIVVVDKFFPSSKTCSVCGELNEGLTLSNRMWTCGGCGTCHDRDYNASLNLERVAASLSETLNDCGEIAVV